MVLLLADVLTAPVVLVSFTSLAVLVGFRSDRVRFIALGCKEEDMVTASFLLLGGGDWMLLKVSVIHSLRCAFLGADLLIFGLQISTD